MKLAVAGLGFMGSTHIKALRGVEGVELAAVISSDARKLEGDLSAIQGNIGGPGEKLDFTGVRKYTTLEQALEDPEIEAFDLCLPTDLHAPAALAVLRAGKHVLVEKPMALNGQQTDELIAEASRSGRILMVAQVLRFWPDYVGLREALGSLGTVRTALFRRRCAAPDWSKWITDPGKSGGGVFDLLIHDADMCIHLFGLPEAVSATGHEDDATGIDFICAQLHYASLPSVTITGGWHHPKAFPFSMEYTVQADGGTIEYSSAGRPATLYRSDGTSEALSLPSGDGFEGELRYFVECCRERRPPALCPPAESAAAVKLMLAMVEARKHKGEKIPCRF